MAAAATEASQGQTIDWQSNHRAFQPSQAMSPFPSRRSTVMGTRGMVTCSQPLASSAGISILEKGGNAADAAVAVAAALNVTEPCSTGIGGDAFCLFWDSSKRKVVGLNGSGRSPGKMTLEALQDKAGLKEDIPVNSVHSVTVPGAPAAWVDTVRLYGSGKLTLEQILAPAIRLADNGYPVHEIVAGAWARSESAIKAASPNGNEMMMESGHAPKAGEIMRMPNLALTFREVATKGKDGFYKGRIAEAIVQVTKAKGGFMELEDLENHANMGTEEITPISYQYGSTSDQANDGVTIHECPPNGQGLVALIALGILDSLQKRGKVQDLSKMEHNSAEYLHTLIEALRFGFADASQWVCDPAHGGLDRVDSMLSRKYLEERARLFDPTKAVHIQHGNPESSSNTVYFSVADADGNACSFINSNYTGFGSNIVPKGCGFTLQNRGSDFKLDKSHPNCVAPLKRPYHTIIPGMATKKGSDGLPELFMSYGVMGGYMQPQGHVQVLLNLLRGHTPQSALDAPRFCIGAGMKDEGTLDSSVFLEEGIAPEVVEKLQEMGHTVQLQGTWERRGQFGRGQIIMRINAGATRKAWAAGCDPRSDGQAIAQV